MAVIPSASVLSHIPSASPIPQPPADAGIAIDVTLLLQHCKRTSDLRQLHAHLLKTSLYRRPAITENFLESAALRVQGGLEYARQVFDHLPCRDSAAYNVMIRASTSDQSPKEAMALFCRMLEEAVEPDKYTLASALKACSRAVAEKEGEQLHAQAIKWGLYAQPFVRNTLIRMYASFGHANIARKVFDGTEVKDSVTWNALFAGYSKKEEWGEVVKLFYEMVDSGASFDEVTLICVLTACGRVANLVLGEWINDYIHKNGIKGGRNLMTSLVDMYAKCGQVDRARELFDSMHQKDVVAWSAMISGYYQANRCKEALELFNMMRLANVEPNDVTMVSVLASCAVLGALETGKWVHSYIDRKRLELTVTLGTALIDFYAKCGDIESSIRAFKKMHMRNVLSWTVLIQGLASNGRGREALDVFSSMIEANVQPNEVTFLAVLAACSHTGLVEQGKKYFDSMSKDYGIKPRIDHYGCMVDVLSRAGLLEEAYFFIIRMPIEPNAIIWRTLLASCKIQKNIEFGEQALKEIIKVEPSHSGDYILLSNIYASVGRWEDAIKVRSLMKEKGIKKIPGCTLIEIEGMIYEFFAEDNRLPETREIYDKLEEVIAAIKRTGYVPIVSEARLDAEEGDRETSVSHHSEKLAIAFGLIKSSPGSPIRISKNLRVCTDCHLATKFISKVFKREIIVRDRNRFHHFKSGTCSCNDYW